VLGLTCRVQNETHGREEELMVHATAGRRVRRFGGAPESSSGAWGCMQCLMASILTALNCSRNGFSNCGGTSV
jgi:hypothetical protein